MAAAMLMRLQPKQSSAILERDGRLPRRDADQEGALLRRASSAAGRSNEASSVWRSLPCSRSLDAPRDPRDIGREPHMSPVGSGLSAYDDQLPTGSTRPPALGPHMRLDENRVNLYRDVRAMTIGDVVTVNISMDDKAVLGNSTDRSRELEDQDDLVVPVRLPGRRVVLAARAEMDGSVNNDLQSSTSTQGQGSINRSEQIRLSVAAVVTAVLPNGNLMLRGSQEIRVNYELRVLTIAGIARPRDIGKDNIDLLRQDRRGACLVWRTRQIDGGAAAGMGPAGLRHFRAVLRQRGKRSWPRRLAPPPPIAFVVLRAAGARARRRDGARRWRRRLPRLHADGRHGGDRQAVRQRAVCTPSRSGARERAAEKGAKPADKGHGGHGAAAPAEGAAKDGAAPKMKLKELAPIVTNLAVPETGLGASSGVDRLRFAGGAAARHVGLAGHGGHRRLSADHDADLSRGRGRPAASARGFDRSGSHPLRRTYSGGHHSSAGRSMKRWDAIFTASPVADAPPRAGVRSQCSAALRGRRSASGKIVQFLVAVDGALGRARPAHHGDELHPLRHRAVVSAQRTWGCRARRPIWC